VRAALVLDGNDPYVHHVAAEVLIAQRKLDDAWAHCLIALEGPSATPATRVLGARIRRLQGDREQARELLLEAVAIEPAHTEALAQLAQLELHAGNRDEASRLIALALESDPASYDAHVIAGYVDLARGDAASAEHHARFVISQDATDEDGLRLWAAVQARRNWLLGAWWRWNLWLTLRSESRRIALVIGSFVVVRVAVIVTDELGHSGVSRALSLAWLGLCAYTWFAPVLFRRMLARSLAAVRLDPDF
jgi:tetratricopeptide (TPR) repeat protein